MNTRSKTRPLNKTSDTDIIANRVLESKKKEQPKRKRQQHEKSSDDDKICWIAYIDDDLFVCKHKYNDSDYFEYTENELLPYLATRYLS